MHHLLIFLDHYTAYAVVTSVTVRTTLEAVTVSNYQSHAYGSIAKPFAASSNLAMLVNVGVCSAVVCVNDINRFDCYWFGTFHAIEGEIPTLTATLTSRDPEITIKLDL